MLGSWESGPLLPSTFSEQALPSGKYPPFVLLLIGSFPRVLGLGLCFGLHIRLQRGGEGRGGEGRGGEGGRGEKEGERRGR